MFASQLEFRTSISCVRQVVSSSVIAPMSCFLVVATDANHNHLLPSIFPSTGLDNVDASALHPEWKIQRQHTQTLYYGQLFNKYYNDIRCGRAGDDDAFIFSKFLVRYDR